MFVVLLGGSGSSGGVLEKKVLQKKSDISDMIVAMCLMSAG